MAKALLLCSFLGAVLFGSLVSGCSSEGVEWEAPASSAERPGDVVLSLTPLSGLTVDTLSYVVTRTGSPSPIRQGILPTRGSGDSLRLGLSLPVGSGYHLSLSGVAAEAPQQLICTGAVGPFSVTLGTTPALDARVECVDLAFGSFGGGLDVLTEGCPGIAFERISAIPAATSLSSPLMLSGAATDGEGRLLTYLWTLSEPVATLGAPTQQETSLTCLAERERLIATLTAFNGQCSKSTDATISCLGAP